MNDKIDEQLVQRQSVLEVSAMPLFEMTEQPFFNKNTTILSDAGRQMSVVGAGTQAVSPVNYVYHDDDLIIVQNRLLHAISRLSLNERRLILFLSVIVRLERIKDPHKREFFVRAVDFAKEYDLGTKSIYRTFASIAKSIQFKPFFYWSFEDNSYNEWGSAWFTDCGYLKEQGGIKVRLSDTVLQMLTVFNQLNPFTKYQKEWITKLGVYGIILLELAVCRLNELRTDRCVLTFTVEYLREKFDCVSNYARFDDFRSRVIDKAIKDVHTHTPLKISYEKSGRGVKTSHMTFVVENYMVHEPSAQGQGVIFNHDPFVNFKMTKKQLSVFAGKIKQQTGQEFDEVMFELSNVHLQGKYVEFLKELEFVPSRWYTKDEIKLHPTTSQITKLKIQAELKAKTENDKKSATLKEEFEILLENAQTLVQANLDKVGKRGVGRMYLKDENYVAIVKLWENDLLDEKRRETFLGIDEILKSAKSA